MKIPTIVGIFIILAGKISCSAEVTAEVSMKKSFYNLGARYSAQVRVLTVLQYIPIVSVSE